MKNHSTSHSHAPFKQFEKKVLSIGLLLTALAGLSLFSSALQAHEAHEQADPDAIIYNGDFSEGGERPDHWLLVPPYGVAATSSSDAQFAHTAPAALRLSVNGYEEGAPNATPLRASVQQLFNRIPARPVTVTGWFKKGVGVQNARVVIRVKNEEWTQELATLPIETAPGNDWTQFSQQITLPVGAGAVLLCYEIEGVGTAWLDDVSVFENAG